ncbi:hypothetical protein F4805DRAFT_478239 [Annulohypoxylon moriforme]|nr:hypothetical protein F4805DRAFT_478239 [Annulohypoxylon moriforme]
MSSANLSTIQPPLDYSNKAPGAVISLSILAFITTIVVALRFWSRRLIRQPFGLDSYLCLASLLMQHAVMAGGLVALVNGEGGRDMRIIVAENPDAVIVLFQSMFVSEIAYTYSSPLVKLSVLLFYKRVFPTRTVRLGCIIIGLMCIAWCIAITILNFVQCRPLKAYWFIELRALPTTKCLDSILCFLSGSIGNTFIDFLTLTLPIHEVIKLQTTIRRKITICCVFLMGSIALAATLVRTVCTGIIWAKGVTNYTEQFYAVGIATAVEIYAAIISACLPTLVPIYHMMRHGNPFKKSCPYGERAIPSRKVSSQQRCINRGRSFEQLHSTEDTLTPPGYYGNHHVSTVRNQCGESSADTDNESQPTEAVLVKHDVILS